LYRPKPKKLLNLKNANGRRKRKKVATSPLSANVSGVSVVEVAHRWLKGVETSTNHVHAVRHPP
jgi:hypothetical protein